MNFALLQLPVLPQSTPLLAGDMPMAQEVPMQAATDISVQDFSELLQSLVLENKADLTMPVIDQGYIPPVPQGIGIAADAEKLHCKTLTNSDAPVDGQEWAFTTAVLATPPPQLPPDPHRCETITANRRTELEIPTSGTIRSIILANVSPGSEPAAPFALQTRILVADTGMAPRLAAIMPLQDQAAMPHNMIRLAGEIALSNVGIVSHNMFSPGAALPVAMKFQLNPPHLGMIDVHMVASGMGSAPQLDLRIVTQSQAVQNLMQSHSAILSNALGGQGFSWGEFDVDVAPAPPVPVVPGVQAGSSSGTLQDRSQNSGGPEFGQAGFGEPGAGHNAARNEYSARHAVIDTAGQQSGIIESIEDRNANGVGKQPKREGRYA